MLNKHEYVRSPKLMLAYRKIACQHCGVDDGTVCGAHSNQAEHGKGKGIKADDNRCASLCHKCHMSLDQGRDMSREARVSMWKNAHHSTVATLIAHALWPTNVPIPMDNQ